MIILGIETSCDETAVSIIEASTDESGTHHVKVLGNTLISQIKIHEPYGGVLPMIAKREHGKNLVPLLYKAIEDAKLASAPLEKISSEKRALIDEMISKESELIPLFNDLMKKSEGAGSRPAIDAIAVTEGPGLEPALWVGISFAKALGALWNVPVIATNHMEGHIIASLLHDDSFTKKMALNPLPIPAIALLISGGHTELVKIEKLGSYKIIGRTRDDAVGEAFDKVARLLGAPYPGGPEISAMAETARQAQQEKTAYPLPRPMLHTPDLDFSFSGLKTSVLYLLKTIPEHTPAIRAEIAKEFEDAVTQVLVAKTRKAIEQESAQALIIGGGVIANTFIRSAFSKLSDSFGIPLLLPSKSLSTDNALMIAVAGYTRFQAQNSPSGSIISAKGNLEL